MTSAIRTLTVVATAALFTSALGQTNVATTEAQAPKSAEQTIKDIKNPFPWMMWGGDFRVRNEYFNNALTLNPENPLHEQDYFRFRARVWTSITPVEDLSLNARLATEPREWMKPAGYTPMKGHSGWDWTEGIIDNLNAQWRNILKQPAAITVGRQDIFLGDGWLVGDGTPFDGSWTYFLDSARFTYELKEQRTTVEAIGIIQDAKDNGWLPPIAVDHQHRFFTEQNEKGAILNVANTSLKVANLTGYFIYKEDALPSGAPRGGDNAYIYTLGGRVNGLFGNDHWKYWAEGAYQFGRKQDVDINDAASAADPAVKNEFRPVDAFGVNSRISYLFKDKLRNEVTFAYEFLSGDDPNTKNDEMFDVLWGRWPQWSEIGLYEYAAETRIGSEANLHRIGPGWIISPMKNLDFNVNYYVLLAQQEVATRAVSGLFTGDGIFRGHFVQATLKYKFSPHLSGHLWGELQFPGDYYVHREMMSFARAEIMLTF
jgi:hypothetical protein